MSSDRYPTTPERAESRPSESSPTVDLVAPCPSCGFYRDTPNHAYGCTTQRENRDVD